LTPRKWADDCDKAVNSTLIVNGTLILPGGDFHNVRLLNPFGEVMLIARIKTGRALSHDGTPWRLQIRSGLKSIPRVLTNPQNIVNTYALHGIWPAKLGLSGLPLNPGIDPVANGR